MNRRSFLRVLGLGATAAAGVAAGVVEVDLERLLWEPGRKTFFLPSAEIVDPFDNEEFVRMFTRQGLKVLKNNLSFANRINRSYDQAFAAQSVMNEAAMKNLEFISGAQWPVDMRPPRSGVEVMLLRERARYGKPFHAIEPVVGTALNIRLPKRFA